MTIKEKVRQVAALAVKAYTEFSESLYIMAKIGEAENRLASVSRFGYSFVSAFNEYKGKYLSDFPYTYLSMIDKATEMLAAGVNEATVLYYFDSCFKKKGGTK